MANVQIHAFRSDGEMSPGAAAALAGYFDIDASVQAYLTLNPPAGVVDATTGGKGVLRLSGDLGGTAETPTVPGLGGKVDKGSIVINVKDYGATGDGTTDDSAEIQAAIDAAKVAGGIVYMPPGTYKIGTALDMSDIHPLFAMNSGASVTLVGAGRHASYLVGGEAAYGFIDLVGSNRVRLQSFSIRADVTCQYAIVGGRTTGDESSGEHLIQDVTIYGAFTKAAVFMMSAELCTYERVSILALSGAGMVLARDLREWSGVSAKHAPLSSTSIISGGNGVISLRDCTLITAGLTADDHPLVLEWVQTFLADNLYTLSSGAALIALQKGIHHATFRGLHQEWAQGTPGATEPFGFLEKNVQTSGEVLIVGRLSIEGSSVYDILGEDPGDLSSGAIWADFSFRSSTFRGTNAYKYDVVESYGADITATSVGGAPPACRIRAAGEDNQVRPHRYTTAGRPSSWALGPGRMIYDTTLKKPLWSDGGDWRDATGTAV